MWALGAIGSVPSNTLLPLLLRRSLERLDTANGMDVSNLIWGFARLDCPVSEATTDRFAVRLAPRAGALSTQGCVDSTQDYADSIQGCTDSTQGCALSGVDPCTSSGPYLSGFRVQFQTVSRLLLQTLVRRLSLHSPGLAQTTIGSDRQRQSSFQSGHSYSLR